MTSTQFTPSVSVALLELTESGDWLGTATQLSDVLTDRRLLRTCPPHQLSALLRNREPDLYWRGVSVRFYRKPGTGERLIEIARGV